MKLKIALLFFVLLIASVAFAATNTVNSKELGFTATFPGVVNTVTDENLTAFDGYNADKTEGGFIGVIFTDLSKTTVDKDYVKHTTMDAAQSAGVTLSEGHSGTFQDYPAGLARGTMTNEKGVTINVVMLVIVAKDRNLIYILSALYAEGAPGTEAKAFFDSFQLQ